MSSSLLFLVLVVLVTAAVLHVLDRCFRPAVSKGRLPPGPHPLPLVGNLFNFPRAHLGRGFRDLSRRYGDVVHLRVFRRSIILLGSYELACDIFGKRSANYSDRPPSVMVKLTGLDWLFAFKKYGAGWRKYRRALHNYVLLPSTLPEWQPRYLRATHILLLDLLNTPEDFSSHFVTTFATLVLGAVYGVDPTEGDHRYYQLSQRLADIAIEAITPGRHAVEVFQFLQYLPSWFPGTGFKRLAANWREELVAIRDKLFDSARRNMNDHGIEDSVFSQMINAGEDEMTTRIVTATMYPAGVDTTTATLRAFMVAMALYPDAQQRAQQELDSVIGFERLPLFSDLQSLPYMHALIKEVTRWHIIAPIGVAHCSVEDDEVNACIIPRGSIVMANSWAFSRDETIYPDPERFYPDRFLKDGVINPDVRDPNSFVFGFGRRVCPGRPFVENWLFITCASILHAFTIGPPLDEHGVPKTLDVSMGNDSAVADPHPFQCRIVVRDESREELIRTASTRVVPC